MVVAGFGECYLPQKLCELTTGGLWAAPPAGSGDNAGAELGVSTVSVPRAVATGSGNHAGDLKDFLIPSLPLRVLALVQTELQKPPFAFVGHQFQRPAVLFSSLAGLTVPAVEISARGIQQMIAVEGAVSR